eukprot:SAG11_NODE_2242_length_3643_cov_7.584368_5_plen_494_part_00
MDGIRDGQARPLVDAYNQCLDVPVSDLVEMLTALRDSGQCPAEILDGVGTTDSKADACEDVWSRNCGMAVESGFLTCDADFCNTVPTIDAPCDLAGHCDRTCGFCTVQDDGNHRRLLMIEAVRRRAQFSLGTCDTANFAAMTAEVDEACCDPGTDVCATGVPGECDAKCAVIYNPLYQQCSRFISAQVGLAAMSAYDRLYSTCTSSLPAEPLLRLVALCSTRDRDPCFEVDCGGHGICDGGTCQCVHPESGDTIDCGEHGSCLGGECRCEDGYSGAACENLISGPCSGEDMVLRVTGAGTAQVNGCYRLDGETHGQPRYVKVDDATATLVFNGRDWNIDIAGQDALYWVPSDANHHLDATDVWSAYTGQAPVPHVELLISGPCAGIDCSGHGQCDDGRCRCDSGWYGERCEVQAHCCSQSHVCQDPGGDHGFYGEQGGCYGGCSSFGHCTCNSCGPVGEIDESHCCSCTGCAHSCAWCDYNMPGWDDSCDRSC